MSQTPSRQYRYETCKCTRRPTACARTNARAVPIYQTSSYTFDSADHGAKPFALKEFWQYSHPHREPGPPTCSSSALPRWKAAWRRWPPAGPGGAVHRHHHLAQAGDNIVSSSHLYGGTYNQFKVTLPRLGIGEVCRWRQSASLPRRHRHPHQSDLWKPGNPSFAVPDFAALSQIAHEAGIPLIVDNTLWRRRLYRPADRPWRRYCGGLGHRWIGGHGTSIGGGDCGCRDLQLGQWQVSPLFTDPAPGHHGLNFWEVFALAACLAISPLPSAPGWKACATSAPACRRSMRSSCCKAWKPCRCACSAMWTTPGAGAMAARASASGLGGVQRPGRQPLPRQGQALSAQRFWRGAEFGIRGGAQAAQTFIDHVELASHLANVGDAKTPGHPPGLDHPPAAVRRRTARAGVRADLIRVSVGASSTSTTSRKTDHALRRAGLEAAA